MKNKNIKKIIVSFMLFITTSLTIIGLGYYKNSLSKETAAFNLKLNDKKVNTIIYDVANEGIPKRIVQPGKITVSTGHGVGIINDTNKTILVQVKAQNFACDVDIDSTDKSFDKESGTFTKPIQTGKGVNLNITFNIPRKNIGDKSVSSGEIVFSEINTGELINSVPIEIINSK
ncbi:MULTISPECIES: hypothetical protein [unclassified Clostridium]|uniref:hypothetical protein n=1 Tax=unclassified Clostridium TaxID=2614128 RepID=UPI000297900B|nr:MULTISPECIES: hypothetical protein [unclassified Clostridium]EKQ57530.1 MAG: hypothetical protein A370_00906 [Clostridium sp. Maddingley MBC34-26]